MCGGDLETRGQSQRPEPKLFPRLLAQVEAGWTRLGGPHSLSPPRCKKNLAGEKDTGVMLQSVENNKKKELERRRGKPPREGGVPRSSLYLLRIRRVSLEIRRRLHRSFHLAPHAILSLWTSAQTAMTRAQPTRRIQIQAQPKHTLSRLCTYATQEPSHSKKETSANGSFCGVDPRPSLFSCLLFALSKTLFAALSCASFHAALIQSHTRKCRSSLLFIFRIRRDDSRRSNANNPPNMRPSLFD